MALTKHRPLAALPVQPRVTAPGATGLAGPCHDVLWLGRTAASLEQASAGTHDTARSLMVGLVVSTSCRAAYLRRARRSCRKAGDSKNVWPMSLEDKKTLKQVVIVHRHGTRFPTKPTGAGNLSWPQRAQFWTSYKGHLTPVGGAQLQASGEVLRERYVGDGGPESLFRKNKVIDGRVLAVYTSNVQRTLQSAWSFLLGFVPDASIFFAFRSERIFCQALKQAVGVPIYVEDATEGDDKLFHEWKIKVKKYKTWVNENNKRSEFFQYAKDAPEYVALLDKLYELVEEPKLAPGGDPLARLTAAKDVDTQVMIEESHNRPILPNPLGEELQPEEQKLLRNIGDELKRCWFGDALGDVANSYGRKGAAYLGHKIWRHMDERAKDLCHLRFVQFSCHDTTMCALAAHLGIELPKIGFGAFFVFELHKDSEGEYFVKFYYNPVPDQGDSSYENLKSAVLPLGREEKIRKLDECEEGSMHIDDLARHLELPDVEETFESFMKLLARADIGPTRDSLEQLLETGKIDWLSFEEWKDQYDASFRSYDENGDGVLCKTEMQAALRDWYGITGKTIEQVFHLVDREPETDSLSEYDVYLAMCAMVGVRGSITTSSAGLDAALLPSLTRQTDTEKPVEEIDVNARSSGGTTKLMAAANSGDRQRIRDLVASGASLNLQDDFGWTALRYAVRTRNADTVLELISLGADPNLASFSGRTPLMSAIANNAPNVVQALVAKGADLNQKNDDGKTAYDIACRGMTSSVMKTLVTPKKPIEREPLAA